MTISRSPNNPLIIKSFVNMAMLKPIIRVNIDKINKNILYFFLFTIYPKFLLNLSQFLKLYFLKMIYT